METILTLGVVIIIGFIIISINKQNIPQELQKKFSGKYPNVQNLDWSKHQKMYEATFFHDHMQKKVRYNIDFKWIETKSLIFKENIPEEVKEVVRQKYPYCKFNDASFIEKEAEVKYFKLIVSKDGINYQLKISPSYEIMQTKNLTFDKIHKVKNKQNTTNDEFFS